MARKWDSPDGERTILVSWPAEKLMGFDKTNQLVAALNDMMRTLGAQKAYVSKSGAAVEIHILGPDGWTGVMKGGT